MKPIYIALSGLLASCGLAISIFILPQECSLLNNDSDPFFNCLQDMQELVGIPKLCCSDFGSVYFARGVALVSFLQFSMIALYAYCQQNKKPPRIFLD